MAEGASAKPKAKAGKGKKKSAATPEELMAKMMPPAASVLVALVMTWSIFGGGDAGPLLELKVLLSCSIALMVNSALTVNKAKEAVMSNTTKVALVTNIQALKQTIAGLEQKLEDERVSREELETELDRDRLFASFRERYLKHVEHMLNNPVQGIILSVEAMAGLVQDWTLDIEETKESDSDSESVASGRSSGMGSLSPRSPGFKSELVATWESRMAEFGSMTELALSAMDSLHVIVTDMYDGLACTHETLFKPVTQPTNVYSTLERVQYALRYHSAYGDVNVVSQKQNLMGGSVPEFQVAGELQTCMTDPRWVVSVALKLIGNARRFSGPGDEVNVHVTLIDSEEGQAEDEMGAIAKDQWLHFEIRDTGSGVRPDFRDLLYTVDAKRSDYHGFGLYMVAAKIHALGGRCGYKPNETAGRGSIFWFEIPYRVTEQKATSREGPQYLRNTLQRRRRRRLPTTDNLPQFGKGKKSDGETPISASTAANLALKRVLIIEDEIVQQKLLTKQLQNLSYEVFVANDGVEGLEALKERPYSLVLCDKLMPRMNGDVCIRQFRRWESSNREDNRQFVCGLSATKEGALPEGFDLYMPKPIRRTDLLKLLRHGQS
ncbi:Hybrid signal transduction histidine kinase K [Hondaea fermentalgiana]|uniref:Hybrid signal transduction histidine kinase K n=1 Tax=Hondaea fermentalgiana TaxID=2315210 RepID=A0A2R5H3B4_9STRA|nr:Hybrid signal transduction histidine kinase K [Hondaea fermentalgiana]|eukprot:GBG34904.1 Hybrid signal transduction histidine kinase K [Hondaea fermentalgiana]